MAARTDRGAIPGGGCSIPPCSPRAATRTCRRSVRARSRSCARCPSGCATATRTTRSASTPIVLYLTGFVEPETTLVLRPGAETERVVMFVRPRDPEMRDLGRPARRRSRARRTRYGADAAYPAAELPGAAVGADRELRRAPLRASASTTRWTCLVASAIARAAQDREARQAPAARGRRSARSRSTSCGCTSGPRSSRRCARPARSRADAHVAAMRPAARACSSTSSRR